MDEAALDARESAKAMRGYLARLGFPEIGCDVVFYIYNDTIAIAEAYARETGWSLENSVSLWESVVAVSSKGWVFLRALDERLASAPRARASHMKVAAHELYHVYQHCLSGLSGGARNHEVPANGPHWLSEGSAEFSAYRAMSEIGELSYDEERRGFAERAKRVDKPLSEMETWDGLSSEAFGYTYSLMAAELLASLAGEGALMRHYELAQPSATWRDAFATSFGMTVDEFYDLFADHRAAGFPNP